MDSSIEKLAEKLAGKVSRRGLISLALRGLVGLGMGAAVLFGGSRAHALIPPNDCDDHFSSGNTCGVQAGYCETNEKEWGCNPNRARCSAQYCDAPGSSNCQGGATSLGYWDCCCDGDVYRCRDCQPPGNPPPPYCICAAPTGQSC